MNPQFRYTVGFRADATTTTGTGHVERCLALAERLSDFGFQATFFCADLLNGTRHRIASRGFGIRDLASSDDLSFLGEIEPMDWLVVDHYELDAKWQESARQRFKHIAVIDDFVDRAHDCDVLVNQNWCPNGSRDYQSLVPGSCLILAGPQYALLRSEFAAVQPATCSRLDTDAHRVFVSFGGTDPAGLTEPVVAALVAMDFPKVEYDIVVGQGNPAIARIQSLCASSRQCRLHVQPDAISELMASSSLAIGAGGISVWERFCCSLPTIAYAVAENQQQQLLDLAQTGRLISLGAAEAFNPQILESALRLLISSAAMCSHLSKAGRALVDGRGAYRVSRLIASARISLRSAALQDAAKLLQWRNAAETRRHSRSGELIPEQAHKQWMRQVLSNDDRHLLIGLCDDTEVGVVRFDCDGAVATVSIYLHPDCHGRGLGTHLLLAAERWLRDHQPQIDRIEAEVLEDNTVSHRTFSRAGYRADRTWYVKELR